MNKKDRQNIMAAAELLQLGESATLAEIKRAYHRLSKLHHPDMVLASESDGQKKMYELVAAYELLKRYCERYRFPLKLEQDTDEYDLYDPQEWWQTRFGQDPIWTGKKTKKR